MKLKIVINLVLIFSSSTCTEEVSVTTSDVRQYKLVETRLWRDKLERPMDIGPKTPREGCTPRKSSRECAAWFPGVTLFQTKNVIFHTRSQTVPGACFSKVLVKIW